MILQKTPQFTKINKFIKKNNTIEVSNGSVHGKIIIKGLRCYKYDNVYYPLIYHVDIEFHGELYLRYVGQKEPNWYDSKCDRRSNVKTNKMIRRGVYKEVQTYLKFFGIEISTYESIKKLTWV